MEMRKLLQIISRTRNTMPDFVRFLMNRKSSFDQREPPALQRLIETIDAAKKWGVSPCA